MVVLKRRWLIRDGWLRDMDGLERRLLIRDGWLERWLF
jgi:hypothetical protein